MLCRSQEEDLLVARAVCPLLSEAGQGHSGYQRRTAAAAAGFLKTLKYQQAESNGSMTSPDLPKVIK